MPIERVTVPPSIKLLAALEASDSDSRAKRASRIEWMGQFSLGNSLIQGQVETLRLLHESKSCFADGHFIATLVLSLGFIEHALVGILGSEDLSPKGSGIGDALALARAHSILPGELLDRMGLLQKRRNPFAHKKSPDNVHSLSFRYIHERGHPDAVLQEDAEEALHLVHLLFLHATNRT